MKEYVYYWYHHMMPGKEREKISKALDNKDYNAFIELYKIYTKKAIDYGSYNKEFECWSPMVYLPTDVSVFDEGECCDEYACILDKEIFDKITHQESECG